MTWRAWLQPRRVGGSTLPRLNPHSPTKATPHTFEITDQRVVCFTADKTRPAGKTSRNFRVGQMFLCVISKNDDDQRFWPESIVISAHNISAIDSSSNSNDTWRTLLINAPYGLVVRDGFASFFSTRSGWSLTSTSRDLPTSSVWLMASRSLAVHGKPPARW